MLRKKRVTISEQAQAAISAGMPVDQALAEHGTPVPAAETPAVAPVVETPAVEPTAETPAVEPVAGTPAVEPVVETPAVEPAAAAPVVEIAAEADGSTINTLLDRLQTAQNAQATQASKITGLEASVESLTANQTSLMTIVAKNVNHMQIALGGAATDMNHLDATSLLAQYQSTLTTFEKRIPVGGKAEVPLDDDNRDGKVVPLVSPGVARATQIRK